MSWAVLDELDFETIGSDQAVALDVFEQVGRVAARGDVTLMSDDELLAGVGSNERTRRQLDAGSTHLLADLAARGVTDERRGLKTGQWIAFETHEPIPTAVRRVTLATRLRDELPAIDQALTEGRIGWPHVEVLCRAANPRILELFKLKLPCLIGLADELPFELWKQQVNQMTARLDFDGGYRPDSDPDASKLYLDASPVTTSPCCAEHSLGPPAPRSPRPSKNEPTGCGVASNTTTTSRTERSRSRPDQRYAPWPSANSSPKASPPTPPHPQAPSPTSPSYSAGTYRTSSPTESSLPTCSPTG